MKIDNWSVCNDRLVGNVTGHPKIADGEHIITSQVLRLDFAAMEAVTRSGSVYKLGEPAVMAPTVFASKQEDDDGCA